MANPCCACHPPRRAINPVAFRAAVERLRDRPAPVAAAPAEARRWELRTIAQCDAVIDRLTALVDRRA